MHARTHTHTRTHTTHTHTHTYTHTHNAHTHARTQANTHTYAYSQAYTHTHDRQPTEVCSPPDCPHRAVANITDRHVFLQLVLAGGTAANCEGRLILEAPTRGFLGVRMFIRLAGCCCSNHITVEQRNRQRQQATQAWECRYVGCEQEMQRHAVAPAWADARKCTSTAACIICRLREIIRFPFGGQNVKLASSQNSC